MRRSRELMAMNTDELMAAYEKACRDNTPVHRLRAMERELSRRRQQDPEAYAIYQQLLDPSTGVKLTPSWHGEDCLGNGEHPGIECCCDECDYYLECFPDWKNFI